MKIIVTALTICFALCAKAQAIMITPKPLSVIVGVGNHEIS